MPVTIYALAEFTDDRFRGCWSSASHSQIVLFILSCAYCFQGVHSVSYEHSFFNAIINQIIFSQFPAKTVYPRSRLLGDFPS